MGKFMRGLWGGFVRGVGFHITVNYVVPLGPALMAGWLGYAQGLPLMYILVGGVLAFAGMSAGLLRFSEWRAWVRIEDKLVFVSPYIATDKTDDGANLKVVQVGLRLQNNAAFPISYRIEKISTTADNTNSAHKEYKNKGGIISPGTNTLFRDAPIALHVPKSKMDASLDVEIKYGQLGNERYRISKNIGLNLRYDPVSGELSSPWFNVSKEES